VPASNVEPVVMSSISQRSQVTFECFSDMWVSAVYNATTWTCGHCTSSIQVITSTGLRYELLLVQCSGAQAVPTRLVHDVS